MLWIPFSLKSRRPWNHSLLNISRLIKTMRALTLQTDVQVNPQYFRAVSEISPSSTVRSAPSGTAPDSLVKLTDGENAVNSGLMYETNLNYGWTHSLHLTDLKPGIPLKASVKPLESKCWWTFTHFHKLRKTDQKDFFPRLLQNQTISLWMDTPAS